MVKRSRVYCNSNSSGGGDGGANRRSVLVSFRALVLCILLCGGAVLGSPPGDRSPNAAAMMVPERKLVSAGRLVAEDVAAAGLATRSGRSSDNLLHIVGTARKIKMFIRHRYLQLFLDGTVNSTYSDTSDYGEWIRLWITRSMINDYER